MTISTFSGAARDTAYINMKIYGKSKGFGVFAAVIPPHWLGDDFDNAHVVSRGRRVGKIAGEDWPLFPHVSRLFPAETRFIEADLDLLADYHVLQGPSGECVPVVPFDLDFGIGYGNDEILGFMQEFHLRSRLTLPLPEPQNIIRVAGPVGEAGFILGGGTWFTKLSQLSKRYLGKNLSELNSVLDWGCGCGRILRHFLEQGLDNVYGADIDSVNLDWIRQNLGYEKVLHIALDPPMPFEDNFFEAVYGHSVFTHLSLPDHRKWIREISRVVRPGGFAFLTFCSEFGTYITRQNDLLTRPEVFDEYLRVGFFDFEAQDVGVDQQRPGYYRLTSQTTEFIRDLWSKHFRIRRIIRGFAEHQDLVVLEKMAPA